MAPRGLPSAAETLPAVIAKLVREVNPEKIILFGSYAHGELTPDSDVDLLVIVKAGEGESYRKRYLRVAPALTPRGFPADILVCTPEEIEERLPRSFFWCEILEKGTLSRPDICLHKEGDRM